jgi:hypothetical protein
MKVQFNKQTRMTWTYIPTDVVRSMDLKKGDEIEFKKIDKDTPVDSGFVVSKK